MNAQRKGSRGRRLVILTYHRVLPRRDSLRPEHLSAAQFGDQARALARWFTVLPLREAADRLTDGSLPPRAVCITFDDGYADNAEVALPLLRKSGLCATFFVATGYVDGGLMWNDALVESVRRAQGGTLDLERLGLGRYAIASLEERRHAVRELIGRIKYQAPEQRSVTVAGIAEIAHARLPENLMMSSNQVRALHAAGMEVGAHSVTHPILTSLPAAAARREIEESRDRLESILNAAVRSFAYPNGRPGQDYDLSHVRAVAQAGMDIAVSTAWGAADRADDRLQLPRVGAGHGAPFLFPLRLLRRYRERAVIDHGATPCSSSQSSSITSTQTRSP